MEKWKVISLVLFILFIGENIILAWGYILIANDENKMNECIYDICE